MNTDDLPMIALILFVGIPLTAVVTFVIVTTLAWAVDAVGSYRK